MQEEGTLERIQSLDERSMSGKSEKVIPPDEERKIQRRKRMQLIIQREKEAASFQNQLSDLICTSRTDITSHQLKEAPGHYSFQNITVPPKIVSPVMIKRTGPQPVIVVRKDAQGNSVGTGLDSQKGGLQQSQTSFTAFRSTNMSVGDDDQIKKAVTGVPLATSGLFGPPSSTGLAPPLFGGITGQTTP